MLSSSKYLSSDYQHCVLGILLVQGCWDPCQDSGVDDAIYPWAEGLVWAEQKPSYSSKSQKSAIDIKSSITLIVLFSTSHPSIAFSIHPHSSSTESQSIVIYATSCNNGALDNWRQKYSYSLKPHAVHVPAQVRQSFRFIVNSLWVVHSKNSEPSKKLNDEITSYSSEYHLMA